MKNILKLLKDYFLNKKPILNKDYIEYWVSDPLLNIKDKYKIKNNLILPLNVTGYYGGGYDQDSYKGKSANCYAVINNCLENTTKNGLSLNNWADVATLNIYPFAGMDLNAYYDRKSIKFFYYFDYTIRKNIYLCESADVVAHELGHAILDTLRPDFWNVQSYEIWALHESFGDIIAILNILENKEILKLIVKETNGDLSKSNTVSRLAEQFAKTLYNVTNGKYGASPYFLRDAVNSFEYTDPLRLPDDADYDKISRECHSFSRIWTGCWYEIFVEIYNIERLHLPTIKAIEIARDISASYILESILEVPCTINIFDALAQKILQIDSKKGKKYQNTLKNIFEKRKILKPKPNKSVIQNLQLNNEKTKKIKINKIKKFNNCFIEIPSENKFELDQDGNISLLAVSDVDEGIDNAISCLNSLEKIKMFGKLFKINNKNIQRQKFIN